ncbi:MAG TPA: methylated-DNA--[protein]-cysteine S-methyltransferase [Thermoanaerobaculia bacterium]|nr:methylated-DNA--[protein]-cysteine S-methyltransferase [Thermoanaerobaculia bacterium]
MPEAQEEGGRAAQEAEAESWRVLMPSPIGALGVELLGTAVTRVVIEPDPKARSGFLPLHKIGGSDFLDEVFGRLSEYFAGARRRLDLEFNLGPCGVNGFARRVLKETAKIPYGKTRTYRTLADAAGRPDSYRQVLSILLENPIPIVIPCHRVITNKSGIGSYIGGCDRKQWLLDLEQESRSAE